MKTYSITLIIICTILCINLSHAQTNDTAKIKYVWQGVDSYDSVGNEYHKIAIFTKLPNKQDSIDFGIIVPFKNKLDSLNFIRKHVKRFKLL